MWREMGRDAADMALLDQISQPLPPITPTFEPPAKPATGSDTRTESSSDDDLDEETTRESEGIRILQPVVLHYVLPLIAQGKQT